MNIFTIVYFDFVWLLIVTNRMGFECLGIKSVLNFVFCPMATGLEDAADFFLDVLYLFIGFNNTHTYDKQPVKWQRDDILYPKQSYLKTTTINHANLINIIHVETKNTKKRFQGPFVLLK